jgi:A/G-specific adenine glycosylase
VLPGFDKPTYQRLATESLQEFRDAVVEWFDATGREYPWRATTDPYAILVSELMLQQTRVETVLERRYFERWMQQFPTVAELATAPDEAILKAWEGLGYYRRARHLREAARSIVSEYRGVFPGEPAAIRSLPGVGEYTTGAILAFAYDRAAPMIDGNVARVLARLFDFSDSIDGPAGKRQLPEWSSRLADPLRARRFQSGLMEIGQRLCKAQRPLCWECPVSQFCASREPERLPVKRARAEIEEIEEHAGYFVDAEGRVFLTQENGARRSGLWRLPLVEAGSRDGGKLLLRFAYPITRYRVWLHVHAMAPSHLPSGLEGQWVSATELESIALGSPYRRALQKIALSDPPVS